MVQWSLTVVPWRLTMAPWKLIMALWRITTVLWRLALAQCWFTMTPWRLTVAPRTLTLVAITVDFSSQIQLSQKNNRFKRCYHEFAPGLEDDQIM
jgi:hypothetical protein